MREFQKGHQHHPPLLHPRTRHPNARASREMVGTYPPSTFTQCCIIGCVFPLSMPKSKGSLWNKDTRGTILGRWSEIYLLGLKQCKTMLSSSGEWEFHLADVQSGSTESHFSPIRLTSKLIRDPDTCHLVRKPTNLSSFRMWKETARVWPVRPISARKVGEKEAEISHFISSRVEPLLSRLTVAFFSQV